MNPRQSREHRLVLRRLARHRSAVAPGGCAQEVEDCADDDEDDQRNRLGQQVGPPSRPPPSHRAGNRHRAIRCRISERPAAPTRTAPGSSARSTGSAPTVRGRSGGGPGISPAIATALGRRRWHRRGPRGRCMRSAWSTPRYREWRRITLRQRPRPDLPLKHRAHRAGSERDGTGAGWRCVPRLGRWLASWPSGFEKPSDPGVIAGRKSGAPSRRIRRRFVGCTAPPAISLAAAGSFVQSSECFYPARIMRRSSPGRLYQVVTIGPERRRMSRRASVEALRPCSYCARPCTSPCSA